MKDPSEIGLQSRGDFLRTPSGASALLMPGYSSNSLKPAFQDAQMAPATGPADVTLRIGTVLVDVSSKRTISTLGYKSNVPGPLIRLREGAPVTVDIFNDTDTAEFVHWHGQFIPADVNGAPQEKSLNVPHTGICDIGSLRGRQEHASFTPMSMPTRTFIAAPIRATSIRLTR